MKFSFKTFLFASIATFTLASATTAHSVASPQSSPLTILESYTFPLAEISGLAWRTEPKTKKRQLVAVGDRTHTLLVADWESRGSKLKFKEVNLEKFDKNLITGQSEWESVFCDESGRIFIVQENPLQIIVVSADLSRIETRIDLKSSSDSGLDWEADVNSKGEGLLPLKNGHMLVVKEKLPISIVEFAPEGSKAQGYNKGLSIERAGAFEISKAKSSSYTQVHFWRMTPETEALLEDSSGLNADFAGNLFLLSDQKNLIASIGSELSVKEKTVSVKRIFTLPPEMKQAEGMVIDEKGHAIIALDRKNTKKPNVFVLSPLK